MPTKLCETCIHHEAEEDTLTTFFCNYKVQDIAKQNYFWDLFSSCRAYVPETEEPKVVKIDITKGPDTTKEVAEVLLKMSQLAVKNLERIGLLKRALIDIQKELDKPCISNKGIQNIDNIVNKALQTQ